LAYFGALARGSARFLWSLELRTVLFLTLWYIGGIPFALWRGGSFEVITHTWLKTLFIFFLLTQTLVTAERIRKLLWAIILSELFVTAFSIIQSSRVTWVGERMSGVNLGILGWNFLGIAGAVTIPNLVSIFLSSRALPASMAAASAKESADDHFAALDQSIRYTLEYPIFGLGLGNFGVASGTDVGRPEAWRTTHNTYTQISSEAGIPALMLFVGLLLIA